MDELLRGPAPHSPDGPEPKPLLDPLLARQRETRPWQVRSAQWRAWELAEAAFGSGAQVRLAGRAGAGGIRGLLTVSVPFSGFEDHRTRESLFLHWVWKDPILTRVPLVFVFEPTLAEVP